MGAVGAAVSQWNARSSSLPPPADTATPRSNSGAFNNGDPSPIYTCGPASVKRHTFQFQEVRNRLENPPPANQSALPLAPKSCDGISGKPAARTHQRAVRSTPHPPRSGGNSKPAWGAGTGPRYTGPAGGLLPTPSSAPAPGQPHHTGGPGGVPVSPGQEHSTGSQNGAAVSGELPSPGSPCSSGLRSASSQPPQPGVEESRSVTIRGGRIATHSRGGNSPLGGLMSPPDSRMSAGAPTHTSLGGRRVTDTGIEGFASPASPSRAAMTSPPRRTMSLAAARSSSVTAAAVSSPSSGPSGTLSEATEGGKRFHRARSTLRSAPSSADASGAAGDARALKKEARSSSRRATGASAGPVRRTVATGGTGAKGVQRRPGASHGSGPGGVSTASGSVDSGSVGFSTSSRQHGSTQLRSGPIGASMPSSLSIHILPLCAPIKFWETYCEAVEDAYSELF